MLKSELLRAIHLDHLTDDVLPALADRLSSQSERTLGTDQQTILF